MEPNFSKNPKIFDSIADALSNGNAPDYVKTYRESGRPLSEIEDPLLFAQGIADIRYENRMHTLSPAAIDTCSEASRVNRAYDMLQRARF
jgi:hypothetical protein